jgi:predicted  nucleic acid-binding Zn-ribbon protein
MDEQTVKAKPSATLTRKGPAFAHFYVLLTLVIMVAGGFVYMVLELQGKDNILRDDLTSVNIAHADSQEKLGKKLSVHLADLEVTLDANRKQLDVLRGDVDKLRAEFVEYRTTSETRLSDLDKGLEEQRQELVARTTELKDGIALARADFGKETETIKGTVNQIQDDAKFIISELGKKAEKSYMRFMERKLKKQITAVSEKVDDVKGNLEQQITSTRDEIANMAGNVGESIKKQVEEHVKIDFVPSATDEEE